MTCKTVNGINIRKPDKRIVNVMSCGYWISVATDTLALTPAMDELDRETKRHISLCGFLKERR